MRTACWSPVSDSLHYMPCVLAMKKSGGMRFFTAKTLLSDE
ncbi:MAG: hypothetical protein JWQ21_2213 [Herminiimonas sp.]|nr:hypothetical protein [Herminiimonas sp.]